MPHARERDLDHNLVAGMATGHKATWSLHLHVERTG
jgi:hypothetical protein